MKGNELKGYIMGGMVVCLCLLMVIEAYLIYELSVDVGRLQGYNDNLLEDIKTLRINAFKDEMNTSNMITFVMNLTANRIEENLSQLSNAIEREHLRVDRLEDELNLINDDLSWEIRFRNELDNKVDALNESKEYRFGGTPYYPIDDSNKELVNLSESDDVWQEVCHTTHSGNVECFRRIEVVDLDFMGLLPEFVDVKFADEDVIGYPR